MRILISSDMEGTSGIVDWEQVTPGKAEYERSRRLMTGDVNAAVSAAFSVGADEVVVNDAHWFARNILFEELDERVSLHCGAPAPISMLQSIDGTTPYDALVLCGYHSRAGTRNGILCHTWSDHVAGVWLNGFLVGEIGLNAALAGHFDTPVITISGDQAACEEARALLGQNISAAVVKVAIARFAARCLPLVEARECIQSAVKAGIESLKAGQAPSPYLVSRPIQLEVEYARSNLADRANFLPGAQRMTGTRLAYQAADMPTAVRAFRTMTALAVE